MICMQCNIFHLKIACHIRFIFYVVLLICVSCDDPIPVVIEKEENGIYFSMVQMKVTIRNTSNRGLDKELICEVQTDNHKAVETLSYPVLVGANEKIEQEIVFEPPAPGIYRCIVYIRDGSQNSDKLQFNIGYDPEQIISPADSKADFDSFWEQTKAELSQIDPKYTMTLLREYSTGLRNIYLVKMKSYGNVEIAGYYAVPKTGESFPVVLDYTGYGGGDEIPASELFPGKCVFRLSSRGQGIQKNRNIYGEWMVYGLGSKDTYYYRGAYMDVIRAVDFVCSRPEIDQSEIIASGGSQGGAFAVVASALDSRIKICSIAYPFFSDFRNNFNIVTKWPKDVFQKYLNGHSKQSWDNLYDILSYFDVKNFAPKIQCPVFVRISLQDPICPPHTQFAIYNLVRSKKEYYVCRSCKHDMDLESVPLVDNFIARNL